MNRDLGLTLRKSMHTGVALGFTHLVQGTSGATLCHNRVSLVSYKRRLPLCGGCKVTLKAMALAQGLRAKENSYPPAPKVSGQRLRNTPIPVELL